MPHKPLQPLASSHRADQFYLFYRITLLQIIRYDNNGRKTDKEVDALCSLSDARGDLMRIAAAVKSIQGSKRAQYFADTRFVEQWMRVAVPLIARWNEIQEYITQ